MQISKLYEYRDKEHEEAIKIADSLLTENHTVRDAKALYPEYNIIAPCALHRPGVNIGALLFLYPQVIAYVPPITKSDFKPRFGIPYEAFLDLTEAVDSNPPFVLPILNHPLRYRNEIIRNELSELLIRMPPSWERWHKVLEITGGTKWFDEADRSINYENIWKISELRDDWKIKLRTSNESFVSKEIKQQIKNNFTDLCLVEKERDAKELAEISHHDPLLAANDLIFSADLFAYPNVMGAGGISNIRAGAKLGLPLPDQSSIIKEIVKSNIVDANIIRVMAEGLEFHNIPKVFRRSFLIEWHRQQWSIRARDLFSRLIEISNAPLKNEIELIENIKELVSLLNEFCKRSEVSEEKLDDAASSKNRVNAWTTFGVTTFLGILGLWINPLLALFLATSAGLTGVANQYDKERILASMWKRHYPEIPFDVVDRFFKLYSKRMKIPIESFVDFQNVRLSESKPTLRNYWWE